MRYPVSAEQPGPEPSARERQVHPEPALRPEQQALRHRRAARQRHQPERQQRQPEQRPAAAEREAERSPNPACAGRR